MSYIDCYSHSYVGDFLGFGVYHPFDKLDSEGYEIGPDNFLFGGGGCDGGGESKSFIFVDKKLCVLMFLKTCFYLAIRGLDDPYLRDSDSPAEKVLSLISKSINESEDNEESNFFHNFNIRETVELNKRIIKARYHDCAFLGSHDGEDVVKKFSAEYKLNVMAGEVFYFFAQSIFSKGEQDFFKHITDQMIQSEVYPRRLFDVFKPAIANWSGGGLIMYRDRTVTDQPTGEIKQRTGDVCFSNEEQIKESMEYKNRVRAV